MILTCRFGTDDIQTVEVKKTDPICILRDKLDISNTGIIKFIFNGVTYMVDTNLKFESIGLTSDTNLVFIDPALAS